MNATTTEPKIHKGNLMRKVRAQLAKASKPDCPPAHAAAAMTIAQQIVRQYALEGVGVWPQPPEGFEWRGDEVVEIESKPKAKPSTGGLADAMAEVRAIDAAVEKAKEKPARKLKPKPAKEPRVLKKDRLVEMLRHPAGATIKEICEAFKIQAHSARGMISTTGKRLGTKATRDEKGAYHLPADEG